MKFPRIQVIFVWAVLFLQAVLPLHGTEESSFYTKKEEVPQLDLVVLHLKNGMKVALKKTSSEEEVVVRLTAPGGYFSLPEEKRASGQLSSQASIRSGIGDYHFDQLHALLYDRSIEFSSDVQPFSRNIEGTSYTGEIETLLNLVQLFFTQHRFEEHAFNKIVEKEKEKASSRSKRSHKAFEYTYMDFNSPGVPVFKPLTMEDIAKADFQTAKDFFENSFRNPSEFACVITGSFDIKEMTKLVEKYLAAIPVPGNHESVCEIPDLPEPFKGIRTKVVQNHNPRCNETVTVLTFPVKVDVSDENFTPVENISQLIYIRLKKVLREKFGTNSMVINVTTEYPHYPCLACPWIKIQYFTGEKYVTPMGQTILSELRKVKREGVTQEEVETMIRKYRKGQRLHENDNYYWLMVLSNYLMWDWKPTDLPKDLEPMGDIEKIQEGLRTYFSLDNYTIISSQI